MKTIKLSCVAFFNSKERLLLIHRNTDRYNHWELPGGKVEEGESTLQTAIREIAEELKLDISPRSLLIHTEFIQEDRLFHCDIFKVVGSAPPQLVEDSFDDWRYFDSTELQNRTNLSLNAQILLTSWLENKFEL